MHADEPRPSGDRPGTTDEIHWMSTGEAARRLGVTSRTVYRLINEGQLPAYRFGRVIRLQRAHVDDFIERSRIQPGTLEHLYPDGRSGTDSSATEARRT